MKCSVFWLCVVVCCASYGIHGMESEHTMSEKEMQEFKKILEFLTTESLDQRVSDIVEDKIQNVMRSIKHLQDDMEDMKKSMRNVELDVSNMKRDQHWKMTDDEFLRACEDGRLEDVKKAIKQKGVRKCLKARNDDGLSGMHLAAQEDHDDVVTYLVKAGWPVDERDRDGMTPLHWASSKGHTHTVGVLLQEGAQPDAKDNNGDQPIHHATTEGHVEVIDLLLKSGADLEARGQHSKTPLYLAAITTGPGKWDLVCYLLAKGANPWVEGNYGSTPVNIMKDFEASAMIKTLFAKPHCNVSAERIMEDQNFLLACKEGYLQEVRTYVNRRGVERSSAVRNDSGVSGLHYAAMEGRHYVVSYILSRGWPVDQKDTFDRTPLHMAASNGHSTSVSLLLRAGAKAAQDVFGERPVHCASIQGHVGVVDVLLKGGAELEEKDKSDRTPLHFAAINNRPELTRFLLEKGADSKAKDKEGKTPLDLAVEKGSAEVIPILEKHNNPTHDWRDDYNYQ